MKSFSQFLTETESRAAAQARKLGLKSDGHGGWLDRSGEFVAKTEGDKLKFYNKNQQPGKDPDQKSKPQAPPPTQAKAQARSPEAIASKGGAANNVAQASVEKKPEEKDKKSTGKTITLAFGRFNPPHIGHEKLIKRAEQVAAGGDMKIYPSRSHDPKKNPLDADMKVSYMKKMFPEYADVIINDPDMRTIFDVLGANSGDYDFVNIVAGPERIAEYDQIANKYNGIDHDGVIYFDFKDGHKTIVAGDRDDKAAGVEGASASKQREAVKADDFEAFKANLPKSSDGEKFVMNDADAQALFDAVRVGMAATKKAAIKSVKDETKIDTKVSEGYSLWEIAPRLDPRGLRDQYVNKKIFNIGDFVESLHTGLVGKIIRRGTNHLICVTEDDNMFKSWIKDVMEAVTPSGVPADQRLIGTDAYLKYARSVVPGQTPPAWGRQFINKYKKKKK